MYFEIIVVLIVLVFLVIGLYKEFFHPAALFLFGVTIFVVFGILTPKEALSGFSNEQIATIILLLLVSNTIQKVGIINFYFSKFLKETLSYKSFLKRMFLSVSTLSAFLNNTPIVALLIPYVYEWSRKRHISPSKLLIPLSFAAILGGTITLIGTSTNLLINGFLLENNLNPFELFDFAYVGIPATLIGFFYIYFLGNKLLPERKDILDSFLEKKKEYLVETVIKKGSPLIGKNIKEANLRNLKGLFLVEVIRKGKKISPVSPSEILEEDDILIFAGQTTSVVDLVSSFKGLSLPEACIVNEEKVDIVEVVISNNSSLINKKVRDTDFRAKYDAAIIGVHRNGEKLKGKIGEIVLRPGDLLLLVTGKDFWKRVEDTTDFYIISKVRELYNIDLKKGNLILAGFILIIILSALKIVPLFVGLLTFISVLVISKITTYAEIKKGIDVNLIIIAALSIAIGKAIVSSGMADFLALNLIKLFSPVGVIGALIGVYLLTNILTEFVTNVAAASIAFPVAISTANHLSLDYVPFVLAVAYGASASFLTPIGYQTNLMVYAVGNYRFKDFIIVGLPLSFIYGILCILILKLLYL